MEETDTVIVDGTDQYYETEPQRPTEKTLWSTEDDGYIKVFIWINGEWNLVIGMDPISNESVKITYTSDDDITEEIDLLDYQYRIGVL